MTMVNIFEAKSQLSRLVQEVETGAQSEIVIARNGRPVARLVPIAKAPSGVRLGVAQGKFIVPDDIDEANPIIARMFGVHDDDDGGG